MITRVMQMIATMRTAVFMAISPEEQREHDDRDDDQQDVEQHGDYLPLQWISVGL